MEQASFHPNDRNIREIDEFLEHREIRVEHQEELLKNTLGATIATVRVNYPGIKKSNYVSDNIGKIMYDDIRNFYKSSIIYEEYYKNREGFIGHFIFNVDYATVKKQLVYIEENHILGRCVDLDVYYMKRDENSDIDTICGVSRRDLGMSSRKCFLCDKEAKICSRCQTHNVEDLEKYFTLKYEKYLKYINKRESISYSISQFALKGIISEISTMPSFGLVSPTTMGSHRDMDYYTFMDSSFAIIPYIKKMSMVGYSYETPKTIFSAIRAIGIECEEEMFKATKGVNTHKGMIFLIGVLAAALGKVMYEDLKFEEVENILKDMCEDILDDFKDINKKHNLTHGERLYVELGFAGIRGEVRAGLPIIFKEIMPKYMESQLKGNNLFAHTLLRLMSKVQDSTIVYRHNIDKLYEVQRDSQNILDLGGFYTHEGTMAAMDFENKCIENNISPGGSADLLAVVIFLVEAKKIFD